MPKVRNAAKSRRQLSRFVKSEKGPGASSVKIEKVSIESGEEVDVEQGYLESAGAKRLVADGDLVVMGAKQEPKTEPEPDSEPKGKKAGGK